MSELRIYLRRDSLRDNDDCNWILRHADGRVAASGNTLTNLPKAQRCHLVLAAELVSIVPARLPDLPLRKLAPLLPGAAEAHSIGEAEQLHVAWLGRDDQGLSWLAVTDQAWLQYTFARLTDKGVCVDAAIPECLLLPNEPKSWSLVRHEDGTLLRVSRIFGLALDQGDPPAGLKLALENEAVLQAGRPERLCLYQGSAMQAAVLGHWQTACGLPIESRGAWSWREAVWPDEINLLQGSFRPRNDGTDLKFLLKPAAWGVIALVTIQLVGMAIDLVMLSREQGVLQTEMHQLAERVLPPRAAIVDPVWQVGALLKSLQSASTGLPEGMASLLGLIGKLQPEGSGHELKVVSYEGGRLSLDYAQADKDWLDKFRAALVASGLTAAVAASDGGGSVLTIQLVAASSGTGGAHGR